MSWKDRAIPVGRPADPQNDGWSIEPQEREQPARPDWRSRAIPIEQPRQSTMDLDNDPEVVAERQRARAQGEADAGTFSSTVMGIGARALSSPTVRNVIGPTGTAVVASILGQEVIRARAASGEAQADFAQNDGLLDRTGSLLERSTASALGGLDRFSSGVAGGRAREALRARARPVESAQNTSVAGETTWDDVKADPVSNLLPYIYDTAISSAPEMGITMTPGIGLLMGTAIQAGRIGQNRAVADGREDATGMDVLTATPFAAASAALERFGGTTALSEGVGGFARSFGRKAGTEGATEFGQEIIESAGGTVGTEQGFNLAETLDDAAGAAVGGAGMGGGISIVQDGPGAARDAWRNRGRAPLTPADRASPLPDDLIGEGRAAVGAATGDARVLMDAPVAAGGRVAVTMPNGQVRTGVLEQAGQNVAVAFDDGSRMEQPLDMLIDAGVRLAPGSPLAEADAIDAQLAAAASVLPTPGQRPVAAPAARPAAPQQSNAAPVAGANARAQFKARVRVSESGGNDQARNPRGSASGRYQFIESTFKTLYQRVYRANPQQAAQAWANNRFDPDVQERLMDAAIGEYSAAFRRAGVPETAGNLYLAHFLGPQGAVNALRVDPRTPAITHFGENVVNSNPEVMRGKTVGDVIAWTRRRMAEGGAGGDVAADAPAMEMPDLATTEFDPVDFGDGPQRSAIEPIQLRADPRPDVAVTTTGREVPVQYAVVELRDLIASNDTEGNTNPAYPPERQPRDRTSLFSQVQVQDIFSKFNARLMGRNVAASQGAPIISPDGVVESGNGRTIVLQKVYAENGKKAQSYRQMLQNEGFDASGMDQPVLVRVRDANMSEEDVQAYIPEANARETAAMTGTENAAQDARALPPGLLDLYQGGDIDSAANRRFVTAYMGAVLPVAEQGQMVRTGGQIARPLLARIEGALLVRAFGRQPFVEKLVDATDSNIRTIGKALVETSGEFAKLREAAIDGRVDPEMDITDHISAAVEIVDRARREGRPVASFVQQRDVFSGQTVHPLTEAVLRMMYALPDFTRPVGRKKLVEALRYYLEQASMAAPGGGLFGDDASRADPYAILGLADERKNRTPDDEEADDEEAAQPSLAAPSQPDGGNGGSVPASGGNDVGPGGEGVQARPGSEGQSQGVTPQQDEPAPFFGADGNARPEQQAAPRPTPPADNRTLVEKAFAQGQRDAGGDGPNQFFANKAAQDAYKAGREGRPMPSDAAAATAPDLAPEQVAPDAQKPEFVKAEAPAASQARVEDTGTGKSVAVIGASAADLAAIAAAIPKAKPLNRKDGAVVYSKKYEQDIRLALQPKPKSRVPEGDYSPEAIAARRERNDQARRSLAGEEGAFVPTPQDAAATSAAPAAAKPEPSPNRLVTDDRAAELRERLKAKLNPNRLNAGIDPEIIAIGTELAVYHIEKGARRFQAFATAIASDLGMGVKDLRQYLRGWYNGARDMMEDSGESVAGMDTPDEVGKAMRTIDQWADAEAAEERPRAVQGEVLPPEANLPATTTGTAVGAKEFATLRIGKSEFPWTTSAEMSKLYRQTIDKLNLGGSQTPPAVIYDSSGNRSGYISYNGRVWRGLSEDFGVTGKEPVSVYDPPPYKAPSRAAVTPAAEPAMEVGNDLQGTLFAGDAGAGSQALPLFAGDGPAGSTPAGEVSRGAQPGRATDQGRAAPAERTGAQSASPVRSGADGARTADRVPDRVAKVKGENWRIEPGSLAESRGPMQKARDNVRAVELVKQLQAEGRFATREEQAELARYVGWGGLANIFPDTGKGDYGKGFEQLGPRLKELLTDDEYATARRSTQYAHYTSEKVVRPMWDLAVRLGFNGGRVFEPGMGTGNFAGMMPADVAGSTFYYGLEFDGLTAQIAKALYPAWGVQHDDYTKTPKLVDAYDLVIGNPPFSATVVKSDPAYGKFGFLLHDFFFAKSLDAVRPGGLLLFVTSAGTMNKVDAKAREYLADRADLVGAIRLPSTAFAENAGTNVTTDIVVLRKRLPGEAAGDRSWTQTRNVPLQNRSGETVTAAVNAYFLDNPDMILGEQGMFDKLVAGDRYGVRATPGLDLEKALTDAMGRMTVHATLAPAATPVERAQQDVDFAVEERKEGSFYLSEAGDVMQLRGGVGVKVPTIGKGAKGGMSKDAMVKVKKLIGIRDALRETLAADMSGDAAKAGEARSNLNKLYDKFVALHGPINKSETSFSRPTIIQQESARAKVREQARAQDMQWDEGDFDAGPLYLAGTPNAEIARERQMAREAAKAAGRPFSEGTFNPDDMDDVARVKRPNIDAFMADQESYRLRSIEHYNDDTGQAKKGLVFFENPVTREATPTINSPEDALLYVMNMRGRPDIDEIARLSGQSNEDVIAALSGFLYRVPGSNAYETRETYLSGNVRKKLDIARAAAEGDPDYRHNVAALEAVQPAPLSRSDITASLGMPWLPTDVIEEFGTKALGLSKLNVQYNAKLARWRVDGDSSSAAATDEWGTEDREAPLLIWDALNRASPKIYRKTRNAEGKTESVLDEAATQAVQDKLASIKVRFREWAWEDEERAQRLEELYNTEYNSLVAPKFDGAYLKTPGINAEWSWRPHQQAVVARIIQNGNTYMAHGVGAGKTSAMIGAGMEMKRLGLVNKPMYAVPNHMLGQFTKEFYEQYPTARIMVADETRFHTSRRKQFVADVANSDIDAVIITHSAFGLLPVSAEFEDNLLQEQVDELREALIEVSDDQENRITRKQLEQQIEQLEQRQGALRNRKKDLVYSFEETGVDFLFVDEAHLFRKLGFATKMGQMKGIDPNGSQAAFDLYAKIQLLETRRPGRSAVLASGTPITNTMAEMFTVQRYLQRGLLKERGLERFDAWAGSFGDTNTRLEQDPAGGYAPVTRFSKFVNVPELSVMVRQFMDVVTSNDLDSLVVRPKLKGGKRNLVVVEQTDGQKSYQSTLQQRMEAIQARKGPPQKGDDILLSVINDGRKSAIDMRLIDRERPKEGSKLERLVDNVHRIWQDSKRAAFHGITRDGYTSEPIDFGPAAQMVFADLGVNETEGKDGSRGISVHQYIRSQLVARGVPAKEIALISDFKNAVQRQRLFNDMNEGRVRILIGSVPKMGTGVNAQKRLIANHNLDPQWYPANDEQRNGRIIRQGNMNPEVEIYDYSTKGTYDSQMWSLMENKAKFIEGFMRGDPSMRDMEDLGESSQYEQAKALTTSDERIIKLTEMRQTLDKAMLRRSSFDRAQSAIRNRVVTARRTIEQQTRRLGEIDADIAQRVETKGDAFEGVVEGITYTERAKFGEALLSKMDRMAQEKRITGKYEKIALMGGFDLVAEVRSFAGEVNTLLSILRNGGVFTDLADTNSAMGLVTSIAAKLRGFEDAKSYAQAEIKQSEKIIEEYAGKGNDTYPGMDEIRQLQDDIHDLEAELEKGSAKDAATGDVLEGADAAEFLNAIERPDEYPGFKQSRSRSMPGTAEIDPAALRERLKALGLSDKVSLAIVDSLSGAAGDYGAGGQAIIRVARDTAQAGRFTLDHEAIHALREMGLFTKSEWSLLGAAAKRDNALMRSIQRRYSDLDAESQLEEAVADMFARWSEGQMQKGVTARLFQRLRDLFDAIRNALRGDGFASASGVMRAVDRGDVGRRVARNDATANRNPKRSEEGRFAAEFLLQLSDVDAMFQNPKATSGTVQGVFAEVAPDVTYKGVETLDDNEYGAERRHLLRSPDGGDIRVYERGDELWLDVSGLREGEGGSTSYQAVGDLAFNTKRTFIGDPDGLSDIALRRRTDAMLSSALKHGTTDHLEPHPRQIAGDAKLGVPPLRWRDGDTLANIEALIDTSLASLRSDVPQIDGAYFDLSTGTFRTADGISIDDRYLESAAVAARRGGASSIGSATLKRGLLLRSLARAESGRRPGLLEQVLREQGQRLLSRGLSGTFYSRTDFPDLGDGQFFGGQRPYENAPDGLMGFAKDGSRQKGYGQQGYRYNQPVRVTLPGGETFADEIMGLNPAHALERARRNWPDSDVQADGEGAYVARQSRVAETIDLTEAARGPRAKLNDALDRFRTTMQDRYLPLLRVQQRVESANGGPLPLGANPYLREELMTGRMGFKLEQLSDNMIDPLFTAMHQAGVSPDELETFLYARHAPERNAQIAKINPDMPDGGSGMSDIEAAAIMNRVRRSGRIDNLEALAAMVDQINQFALKTRIDAGLLSQEEADAWQNTYEFYVPLRGQEEVKGDATGLTARVNRSGGGLTVTGKEAKRAYGRRSQADNILAYTLLQAEEAIVRAETNRVATAFVNLAERQPDPEFWEVNKVTRKAVLDPNTGLVRYENQSRIQMEDKDYTVTAKIDGEEVRVTMNRYNPSARRLADSMKNLTQHQLDWVVHYFGMPTRFLSAVNTSWNPEFIITNAFRDIQSAALNIAGLEKDKLLAGTMRDYRKALVASTKGAFGKGEGEWARWYKEFSAEGGRVYFNKIDNLDDLKGRIVDGMTKAEGRLSVKRGLLAARDFVEAANSGVENAVRLSVYKNARELGLSKAEAASIAKNVTVNFNRRGTAGPFLNSFYMFFNASVQGTARLVLAMRSKRVQKVMAGVALGSFMLEMLNAMLSDDDEDGESYYDKISAFDKNRNIIIMVPGGSGGEHIKIPMPYGYNVFAAMGRTAAEVLRRGGDRGMESLGDFATAVVDAFNPIGGTESLLNLVSPTLLDPLVDLTRNRDYLDRPIMPEENQYGPSEPDAQRYFNSVSPFWKSVTDTLSQLTGGDEVIAGNIDVSPETLEYLAGTVLGAAGAFLDRQISLGAKALDADETIEAGDLPMTRKVYGAKPSWYDRSAYFDRSKQVEQVVSDAGDYLEVGDRERFESYVNANERLLTLEPEMKAARRDMRAIRKVRGELELGLRTGQIDDATYRAELRVTRDAEDIVIRRFNTRWNEVMHPPAAN